ncbi:MAG: DNA-directed RNA polymerase subunit beta [Bavariicoccus seileri]|uniref:DNA-directed RNA polymerase subunit beta n=1 Tax=Bavariicoccus seileri TaxID=549685 RepID=UPI0003B5D068
MLLWLLLGTLAALFLLAIGLMIGYGIVGDGKATDILDPSTWQNLMSYFNR